MKTLKIFAVMIFIIMIKSQIIYSFEITISNPCIHPAYPSTYFYPNGMISVDFLVDSISITDSKFARCKIFVVQRNTEILMYDYTIQTGNYLSTPINVMDFPNLAYNESVKIRMEVTSAWFPQLPTIKSAYAMVFKEGGSTYYYSISNGSPQLINSGFATFYNSLDCNSLASSNYYTEQYKITFTLQGDFRDSIPVVDSNLCLGWNGALPGHQKRWGYKISQTDNEAKFITFVCRIRNILGQDMGFRPCTPPQATIVYHYVQKPVINIINQVPTPLSINHNIGLFSCNLLQGNGNLRYSWKDSNNIHNHQLIPIGEDSAYLIIIANLSNTNPERQEWFSVLSEARNEAGHSGWKKHRVLFGQDPPHGCPQMEYSILGYNFIENKILIKSPGNPGTDVNDYLLLSNPLYKTSDSIVFSIKEPDDDVTNINMLKMYQAAVPIGKEFVVTDDGESTSFTMQAGKNKVTLNDKYDVTADLENNDGEELEMKTGDEINVSFPQDDKCQYIVYRMRTIDKAQTAAKITTSNGENINIYSRSNMSTACIRVKDKNFNGFTLKAEQDCYIESITVVENDHSFDLKELNMLSAVNSKGKVGKLILEKDEHSAIITKDDSLKLIFKNERVEGKNVYYFVNILGKYTGNEQSDNIEILKGSPDKLQFRLYDNEPNPFNPVTKIKFQIPEAGLVKLTVYDISGREIQTLINEFKADGIHELNFDGSNFASGVYFYKLESGNFTDTKRMFLIK